MARLRRLVLSDKIFFLTTNLKRGSSPFTPKERGLLCDAIAAVRTRHQFRLAAFVIMPDHMHLLLRPAAGDTISSIVQELKSVAGRRINTKRDAKGTLWQKGFFDRFMRTPKEFFETFDYLHQNPVRKSLAAAPEEWWWSSAAAYAGLDCIIPVDFLDLPAQSEKRL
ncbi:MAG: transposase [Terriglobia bacterium]